MASSIRFNGVDRFRPNVYTNVIVTEAPAQASTGAVAIVGDFPQLKPSTPITFKTLTAQKAYFHGSSQTLDLLAELAYRPTQDQNASIQSLTLVNANQSTQASHDFGSITVSSKLYGVFGNRLSAKIEASGDLYDLSVSRGQTVVEKAVSFGEGNIASIRYAVGNTLDEMLVSIGASDFALTGKIVKSQADVHTADVTGNLLGASVVASGNVTLTSDTNQAGGDTTFTIEGTSLAGATISENLVMTDGTQTVISTNSFGSITRISGSAIAEGQLTITFPVFTKAVADISDFSDELDSIKSLDSLLNGTFTVVKPARKTTGLQLDEIASTNCVGSAVNFSKDAYSISNWFNKSAYVEATLDSRGTISASVNPQPLTGGSRSNTVSDANFQSAFDSLKIEPVNIVVPFTDAISVHKIAREHAKDSANQTGYDRNIWVGSTPNQTINSVFSDFSYELDDRNVAVVCQSIKIGEKTYDPKYLAVILASMQGATPVGTPLTRKLLHPAVLKTSQNFVVEDEASNAIVKGIVLVTDPRGTGLNIERSVTTYLEEPNNLVYTEVSANESLNIAVRTVRNDLQELIGTKITAGKQNDVRRIVTNSLQDMVKVGFILSFQDVNVALENDTATVSFSISVIQPLNFIVATINVG